MSSFANQPPGLGWTRMKGHYQLGHSTLNIPLSIHQNARKKLVNMMNNAGYSTGIVILEGGKQLNQYDTDTEPVFRQDSWFNFLFGVHESEFYGGIDLSTGNSVLFMPRLPDVYR